MSDIETTNARGRPVDLSKRAAIIAAAKAEILSMGFEAASIEAIASRARVSKMTVYRQFADKTGLFAALVEQESDLLLDRIRGLSKSEGTLAAKLVAFGEAINELIAENEHRSLESVIEREAQRHPQLATRFFASGPARLHSALTEILVEAEKCGEIEAQDPSSAAEHLIGLFLGLASVRRRFLPTEIETKDHRRSRISEAVSLFLRAHTKRPTKMG